MKKKIILLSLIVTFLSSQSYASTIKTISSVYKVEAGSSFSDGDIKTQKTSGGLFYAMGEDGHFNWVGTGTKKDQFGQIYSGYGFVNYKRTSSSLTFTGYGGTDRNESTFLYGNTFLQSEFDWNFKIEGGDALLNYVFLTQSGEGGRSNLYDITDQKWVFDSGELLSMDGIDGSYKLESNHQYQYSNSYTSYSRSMEGYIDMRFKNATMKLPTPATFGIFSLACLGLFGRKKHLKMLY